jgi:hypothetical protein
MTRGRKTQKNVKLILVWVELEVVIIMFDRAKAMRFQQTFILQLQEMSKRLHLCVV